MRRTMMIGFLLASAVASSAVAADLPTLGVVARIAGADGAWDYASVNSATHTLYVARSNGVMAVNLATTAVTAQLVPGDRVHGVIAVGDSGLEASANGNTNTVTLFDPASGKVKASIATGQGPDALAFDPATGLLVALDGKGQDATLIDPKAGKAVGTIPLGGKPEFAVSNGRGILFDNLEDKSEFAVIDLKARSASKRIPLAGCEEPSGLAYDKQDNLVMSACANGVAKFVDADSGKERASVKIGEGPDAAMFDEARRVLFVPCGRSGTLSVIAVRSASDISVVQTVTTQLGARTGAVDLSSGKIYLPTAKFQLPVEPGKRPTPVPGTFEILVVGPAR